MLCVSLAASRINEMTCPSVEGVFCGGMVAAAAAAEGIATRSLQFVSRT
jgi:hypothetical protein